MNALDQAFIKAFAKDRTLTAGRKEKGAPEVKERFQPPAEGVQSEPLVLRDAARQSRRLRVDRPEVSGPVLDSHLAFPAVESVDVQDVESVNNGSSATVFRALGRGPEVESSSRPMEPIPPETRPTEPRTCETVPFTGAEGPERDAETDVDSRKEAMVDRDVPTLGIPADQSAAELEQASERLRGRAELPAGAERVESWPGVSWVGMELESPDLVTLEFGGLDPAERPELGAEFSGLVIPATGPDLESLEHKDAERGQVSSVARPAGTKSYSAVDPSGAAEDRSEAQVPPSTFDEAVEAAGGETTEPAGSEPAPDSIRGDAVEGVSEGPETEMPQDIGAATPSSASASFAPAWEVDAFRWPELCRQLDQQTGSRLQQAGEELFAATGQGLHVLALTSCNRSEGRTTAAVALARSAMVAGARVALVDADAGNPQLARRLGMEAPCDWCEVLRREESLSEAAVASLNDHVSLFPKEFEEPNGAGISSSLLARMLNELKQNFDLVVVDLPPADSVDAMGSEAIVETASTSLTSCPIDMAVVVRNVQETSPEQCLSGVSLLRGLGVPAVGVIENCTQSGDVAVCHRTRPGRVAG